MRGTAMTKQMDCCTDEPAATERQGGQTMLSRMRSWIVTPRGLTVAGIGVVAIGSALNWSWLVAVGAAPLILSLAPCAAMCALGVCMNMRGRANPPVERPGAGAAVRASELTPTRANGAPS